MLQLIPYSEILPDEWNNLVIQSPDGWTWALTGWRDTILDVERWALQDFSFAVKDGSGLVAVMPLQYFPARNSMESSGWGLCGPIVSDGITGKYRKKILNFIFQNVDKLVHAQGAKEFRFGASPVVQRSLDAPWGVNPYSGYGFEDVSSLSQVIDLSLDEQQLWQDCSETARQIVNKARKNGFYVCAVDWLDYLDYYYNYHVETYNRTGVQPHPKSYFEGIAKNMQSSGNTILWCCFNSSGTPVAFHNSCIFAHQGLYHTGCSCTDYLKDGVNYLLFFEAMLGLKKKGIRWYECGNVFPTCKDVHDKRKGLTEFKTKFGGDTHRSFVSQKIYLYPSVEISENTGRKQLAKNFFHSGKMLLASFIGHSYANSIGKVVKFPWHIIKKIQNFHNRPSRIAFIRPSWQFTDVIRSVVSINTANTVSAAANQLCQTLGMSSHGQMFLTSSGRVALEFALRAAAGLFPERNKVILPTYACKGVLDPVLNCGLTPVFIDCEPGTLLADPVSIRERVEDKSILACIYVYLGGVLQDMTSLREAAQNEGIFWIGDYCQSYLPHLPYEKDDFAIFSFSHGKILAATAGGAVYSLKQAEALRQATAQCTRESSLYAIERLVRQCLTYFAPWPLRRTGVHIFNQASIHQYEPQGISNTDARLLISQLPRLDAVIQRREIVGQELRKGCPSAFLVPQGQRHLYTKFSLIAQTQEITDSLWTESVNNNIELEGMYIPLHMRLENTKFDFFNAHISESIYKKVFNIPCRENLTLTDIQRIGEMLCKVTRHI